jgi:hypothetical protein
LPAIEMTILEADGDSHRATQRVAEALMGQRQSAKARPVRETGDLTGYQGFVIDRAVHFTHGLKDPARLVKHQQDLLARDDVKSDERVGPLHICASPAATP